MQDNENQLIASDLRHWLTKFGDSLPETAISLIGTAAKIIEEGEGGIPDLTDLGSSQLRFLKRRLRKAKAEGRDTYNRVPISLWSTLIMAREIALGVGTKGGTPVKPL
jgi:hypothetical protein